LTLVVLLILVALWAVVLLPPLLRARSERSVDTIGDFNYRLGALGKANGTGPVLRPLTPTGPMRPVHAEGFGRLPQPGGPLGPVGPEGPSAWAARRRRDVASLLGASAVVTLLVALVAGGDVWLVHLLVDAALLAYLGLWAYYRQIEPQRRATVHFLPRPEGGPTRAPDLTLRRTASGS
jgi:hypothetical protein